MLQPFYKGGAYEKILNENVDSALFDETFIVFEVDAIKENKKLFPIVTLIIMDVFLQKMRITECTHSGLGSFHFARRYFENRVFFRPTSTLSCCS